MAVTMRCIGEHAAKVELKQCKLLFGHTESAPKNSLKWCKAVVSYYVYSYNVQVGMFALHSSFNASLPCGSIWRSHNVTCSRAPLSSLMSGLHDRGVSPG